MGNMRTVYIIALILFTCTTVFSGTNPHIFTLDWQIGVQYGTEWRFGRFNGAKVDAGISLMGLIIADSYYVFYLRDEEEPVQVSLLAGITNVAVPISFNAGMVAVGGSVLTSITLSERLNLDLKIGAGFPVFFEKNKDSIRDISFPLNLWPDAGISLRFY